MLKTKILYNFIGIETKFKNIHYPVLVAVTQIPELLGINAQDSGIVFGASTSLSDMECALRKAIAQGPGGYSKRPFNQ